MPTPRLSRTSTFKIAILYLVLFGASVTALMGFVYWSTAGLISGQMAETIQAEIRGLAEQYRTEGLQRLAEVIQERSGPGGDPEAVYLLTNPRLRPLAGNLERWPEADVPRDGWAEVKLRRSDDPGGEPHAIRARVFELPGGYHLLVGRDAEARSDFRRIIVEALAWALIPALALGLLGGVLIGRYSLRRVDAVRRTSQQIIKGDLSRRVPVSGSGDEFDRLADTINDMLDQIDKLMSGMRAVTDSLAHDLRSPLTRAKGSIELALRKGANAQAYREALEQTNSELDTILRTFEALINIAQAEAGMNRLSLVDLDLSRLINDMFEVYQPIAEEAGLGLTAEIDDAVRVSGHRTLLGHAVSNLLDNAIKYTPAGGRIAIRLTGTGGGPALTVCDTGPGIPAPERARVLERFVRLDDSRGTPGSGLGLSLVAAVAKLHDARLELGDERPGLRITLAFPGDRARPAAVPPGG